MNKPNNMKNRQRGRNGGKPRPMGGGGGPSRNPNYDGGNMRPRGNAQQLMEKFLAMARDASAMGDRVAAENYFQHADHYYRVLNARFEAQQQNGNFNNNGQRRDQGHYDRQGPDDRQGHDQGGEPQSGNQGYERQDFNRQGQDRSGYGGQSYAQEGQPVHQDARPSPEPYHQPQPSYQPQPQPQPPQPVVAQPSGGDIGLPPGILGMEAPAPQRQEEPALEAAGDESRGAPRRRRGRGQGGPRGGAAEVSERD